MPGERITLTDAGSRRGGAPDGAGDPERRCSLRGGPMLTTDRYRCTWGLFESIASPEHVGQSA